MNDLLPCPFCGGHAALSDGDDRWDQVICGSCGCRGAEFPQNKVRAILAWNRRDTKDGLDAVRYRFLCEHKLLDVKGLAMKADIDAAVDETMRKVAVKFLEDLERRFVHGEGEGKPVGLLQPERTTAG